MDRAARGQVGRSWLARSAFLRGLGFIYAVAFAVGRDQAGPLIGEHGLLPAGLYLQQLSESFGGRGAGCLAVPSVFWLDSSTAALRGACALGLGLSLAVVAGLTNAGAMAVLWGLQLSLVGVGQLFWGYGWETLLCEAGFLAIFLCPLGGAGPLPAQSPPPPQVFWLLRWVLFRLVFGAGLIKLRGDPCWRDLTCLAYHYETQPIPNPLSGWLHHRPLWFHQAGVLFNHFVELVVPPFLFGPRRVRQVAGLLQALFQVALICSGNLSFLNWLTMVLCLSCFDDAALGPLFPRAFRARAAALPDGPPEGWRRGVPWALVALVAVLSVGPVENLLSPQQQMNSSFDRLHLVNTYGAFGTVGRERDEVILEGTRDEPGPQARWVPYEFPCKPGDLRRRPCVLGPYQLRLDWQMWFAALSEIDQEPWLVHLVEKLLRNDAGALSLLAGKPFPGQPPRFIRAERYRYRFADASDRSGAWWTRERLGSYLRPVSLEDPDLRAVLAQEGWLTEDEPASSPAPAPGRSSDR